LNRFARIYARPRAIAWLVRPAVDSALGEWERFEEIIRRNSATLGGYYNVVIPLEDDDTVSAVYQTLLQQYDPDIVVLAPAMKSPGADFCPGIFPYNFIPWESVEAIVSKVASHPTAGAGPGMRSALWKFPREQQGGPQAMSFVAVADDSDEIKRSYSRLALIVCGDVAPQLQHATDQAGGRWALPLPPYRPAGTPMGTYGFETINISAVSDGYREEWLRRHLQMGMNPVNAGSYMLQETGEHPEVARTIVVNAPDSFDLTDRIRPANQFPLSDPIHVLYATLIIQGYIPLAQFRPETLLNATACYAEENRILHTEFASLGRPVTPHLNLPRLVILTSEEFGLQDAILFWNLRASDFLVAWLPLDEMEARANDVLGFLNTHFDRSLYHSGENIADLSSGVHLCYTGIREDVRERLESIIETVHKHNGTVPIPGLQISDPQSVVLYDFERPWVWREDTDLNISGSKVLFVPSLPSQFPSGIYVLRLEWNGLMLPPSTPILDQLMASRTISGGGSVRSFHGGSKDGKLTGTLGAGMPQVRFGKDRYARIQTACDLPIEFTRPSPVACIEAIVKAAGFDRIEPTQASRYHRTFVERSGGIGFAATHLSTPPCTDLLQLLAGHSNPDNLGWLVTNPDKRRVITHVEILNVMRAPVPIETSKYATVKHYRKLTALISDLLHARLIEQGFELTCSICQYRSWYPAQAVGQEFQCTRCSELQVCSEALSPLFKLPEVIYQGFADHMEVPILGLEYFQRESTYAFEWVPDSNICRDSKDEGENVDLICLADGRLILGEAKCNGEIGEQQLKFYEELCDKLPLDTIVFATTKSSWKPGTQTRIDALKVRLHGRMDVVVLTKSQLMQVPDSVTPIGSPVADGSVTAAVTPDEPPSSSSASRVMGCLFGLAMAIGLAGFLRRTWPKQ
jgi:hypothetical protein